MHTLHFVLYGADPQREFDVTCDRDVSEIFDEVILELVDYARWSDGLSPGGEPGWPAGILSWRMDPAAFRRAIAKCRRWQCEAVGEAVVWLAKELDIPLPNPEKPSHWPAIGHELFRRIAEHRDRMPVAGHPMWCALKVMKLVYGEYEPESHFYDLIHRHTCIPCDEELEALSREYDLYLVPVDLHC